MMYLGQRLRRERIRLGLSQRAVAKMAGVSYVTIANWEHNRKWNGSIRALIKMSTFYQIDVLVSESSFPDGEIVYKSDDSWEIERILKG